MLKRNCFRSTCPCGFPLEVLKDFTVFLIIWYQKFLLIETDYLGLSSKYGSFKTTFKMAPLVFLHLVMKLCVERAASKLEAHLADEPGVCAHTFLNPIARVVLVVLWWLAPVAQSCYRISLKHFAPVQVFSASAFHVPAFKWLEILDHSWRKEWPPLLRRNARCLCSSVRSARNSYKPNHVALAAITQQMMKGSLRLFSNDLNTCSWANGRIYWIFTYACTFCNFNTINF